MARQWQGPDHWRDTHFQVEGPVVAQFQAAFLDNWMQASGEVLHGRTYFPDLPEAGEHYAQMFTSSPAGGAESMNAYTLIGQLKDTRAPITKADVAAISMPTLLIGGERTPRPFPHILHVLEHVLPTVSARQSAVHRT